MRQYECECTICRTKRQIAFWAEPYPELGETIFHMCRICQQETAFTRTLTKKTRAEIQRKQKEQELQQEIVRLCNNYGFLCRFLFQSVIITTELSDWCFDYHQRTITLYHESTTPINYTTGDYAKSHVQFRNRKMTVREVIDYIAAHDQWRREQNMVKRK